jgi:hypothetical protein
MEELKLELNHTYLLRYGCTDTLSSITVLMITDKAYKVRWNGSGSECWELKRRMSADYTLVEDISDFLASKPEDLKFDITYKVVDMAQPKYFMVEEQCPICGGTGQVPNTEMTACYKTCPACNGSGKKSKRVDIFY